MKQSVNCVLLVSDDKATNFFNKMVLNRHEGFDQVISAQSTSDAMLYLKAVGKELETRPDLILLDVDMNDMKARKFLVNFNELDKRLSNGIKIILLTISSNSEEIKKTMGDYRFDDFISKPLSFPLLNELLQSHFPSRVESSF